MEDKKFSLPHYIHMLRWPKHCSDRVHLLLNTSSFQVLWSPPDQNIIIRSIWRFHHSSKLPDGSIYLEIQNSSLRYDTTAALDLKSVCVCFLPRGEIGYYRSTVNWLYFTSTSSVSSLTGGALWMLSGRWHLPVWENYFCVFVRWHREPSCYCCYFWLHNMHLCCNRSTQVEKKTSQ